MAVDDAELLRLAGGDSSDEDEEAPQQATTHRNANSPLPSIEVTQAGGKSKTSQSKPTDIAVRRKTSRPHDSEEEGEASSHDSNRSASMSQSESEISMDGPDGPEANPYPIENKFESESDKKRIMALPEVERESILAERAQILERKQQDQTLRRLLQQNYKEDGEIKSAKRKAPTDVEESPRKSSRQKTTLGGRKVGEASKTIEAYKRQREERGLKAQQKKASALSRQLQRARSSSDARYSSVDADAESEVEWDDGKSKLEEERFRTSQPGDYNDFRRATLNRWFLAEFCYHPGFNEKIENCYVRLPQKSAPGAPPNAYQLVQIKSVFEKEGWPYAMMKQNGKKFVTTQHLLLAVEGGTKEFHMNAISNTVPSEVEVANHKDSLSDAGKAIPTRRFLVSKLDDINALINYHFTEAELQRKFERSGIHKKRNDAIEHNILTNRRRAALERGDEASVVKYDEQLAALEGPRLKYGTSLEDPKPDKPTTPAGPTQQERLAELNRINRKKNTEDVRKAQLAERKAARLAREAVARGEAVEDPFARVKTKAQTFYDVNETLAPHRLREQNLSRNTSRSATPSGVSTPKLEPKKVTATPSPHREQKLKNGLPVLGSRNMDDEIIASLDLGIDIEI